jgi:hypothetical protein
LRLSNPIAARGVWLLLLACPGLVPGQGTCPAKNGEYNGYTIVEVKLIDPVGFIIPWNPLDQKLRDGLKLKTSGTFTNADFQSDVQFLGQTLDAQFASSNQKVKFTFAQGSIVDCSPAQPDATHKGTLRVRYPIFTSVLALPMPTIEEKSSESQRPSTTGATRAEGSKTEVLPLGGNDTTRGYFGGLAFLDRNTPLDIGGRTELSGNSRFGLLTLGTRGAARGTADHPTVLAATLQYEDTPAGSLRYRETKVHVRVSSATKEFSESHSILRFGGSGEFGRQDSSGAVSVVPANSNYASLKLYAGLTGRPGRTGFTASAGLQLGRALGTNSPLFKKYLLDVGYNYTFGPKPLKDDQPFTHAGLTGGVHRSVYLDTHFTGGLIQDAAGAPLAERFFGGNVVQRFIPDDSWSIPAGAFIRSVPENRLGSSPFAPGGTRFYSGNATIAFTAWGRPFLPKEIIDTPSTAATSASTGFPEILNLPFNTAAKAIANTMKLNDPAFLDQMKDVSKAAATLSQKNESLFSVVKQIPAELAAQPEIKPKISAVRSNLFSIRYAANQVAQKPDPQVVGTLSATTVPAVVTAVNQLTQVLTGTAAAGLIAQLQSLSSDMSDLTKQMARENDVPDAPYLAAAWKKLAPGHRALDVILHDLNIYSISPAVLFDVARVWPAQEGVRYGIGPGVRLSLFNVNVTFGYSYSPRRLPGEKPGAIYVKLDITNMF